MSVSGTDRFGGKGARKTGALLQMANCASRLEVDQDAPFFAETRFVSRAGFFAELEQIAQSVVDLATVSELSDDLAIE